MSQVRRTYDFKSVGQLQDTYEKNVEDLEVKMPIGIRTPISFTSSGNSMFDMSYDIASQIKDNLRNLLATNHGERLSLSDFGANLLPLAFEFTAEDTDEEAARRIIKAVKKYMPFVELDVFEPSIEKSNDEDVIRSKIKVMYSVPNLALTNQAIEVIIFVAG